MNIARLLARSARRSPSTVALSDESQGTSYRTLAARVARLAGALRTRGLEAGQRVVLLQGNSPALVESLLACFHAGLVAVPMNARATPHEVQQLASDCDPAAWIYDDRFVDHVDSAATPEQVRVGTTGGYCEHQFEHMIELGPELTLADVEPDHPAWIFYTSGTTGRMKGAVLSHRNLLQMVLSYLSDIASADDHRMRVLHVAPLTHGSGLYLLPHLAVGATQVISAARSYEPESLLDLMAREEITQIAFLAPTMLNRLVDAVERHQSPPSGLTNVVYGGAPMYASDLRRALDALGPVLTQIYGQAEAPMTITRSTRQDHEVAYTSDIALQSVGRAFTAVEVATLGADGTPQMEGSGEVLVRGGVVMNGYWNEVGGQSGAFSGWLHTGDIGELAPDGSLRLLDRSKDVIITGGSNVYPREIEEILIQHPRVHQVTVIGAPDREWGERVVAVMVGDDAIALDRETVEGDLTRMCREKLSGFKLPRRFEWVDQLPTNSYGKIVKREVRNRFWEGREGSI